MGIDCYVWALMRGKPELIRPVCQDWLEHHLHADWPQPDNGERDWPVYRAIRAMIAEGVRLRDGVLPAISLSASDRALHLDEFVTLTAPFWVDLMHANGGRFVDLYSLWDNSWTPHCGRLFLRVVPLDEPPEKPTYASKILAGVKFSEQGKRADLHLHLRSLNVPDY